MRLWKLVVLGAFAIGIAAASVAQARDTVRVTIRINETSESATVEEITVPGCDAATATATRTLDEVLANGNTWTFIGTKTVNCPGSGSFTFAFRATVSLTCRDFDTGFWKITSGTGAFANLSGRGHLIGTYYPEGTGGCSFEGIVDAWTGVVSLG